MVKKLDKIAKEKPSTQTIDESVNKSPEPYQFTGVFAVDFIELCKENNINYSDFPIQSKSKRPASPTNISGSDTGTMQTVSKRSKEDKKQLQLQQQQQLQQMQQSQEENEIIEVLGFKPKTFQVKNTFDYLKPCIQVESDNLEKPDTVSEIFIRAWKIEENIFDIFDQCFKLMLKLNSINLWKVNLDQKRLSYLANILSQHEHIKWLSIEGNNPIEAQNYYEFIQQASSHLTKLSLRYNWIGPIGIKCIADELGSITLRPVNTKLTILDLTGNPIGNQGAIHLANMLKMNRSLLQLTIRNCDIGDEGAIQIAQSISQYFLTDEEIMFRRQLLWEKTASERAKSVSSFSLTSRRSSNISPPPSRRGESKDRPGSTHSSKQDTGPGAADKANKTAGKSGPSTSTSQEKLSSGTKGKKDDKAAKSKGGKTEEKLLSAGGSKKASSQAEPSGKSSAKPKGTSKSRSSKPTNQTESNADSTVESGEPSHPLLGRVESIEPGKLLIISNFILIMLNLSGNRITEYGLNEFKKAMAFQTNQMTLSKVNGTGLMKLFIRSNQFSYESIIFKRLEELMSSRDPKSNPKSPDLESVHE